MFDNIQDEKWLEVFRQEAKKDYFRDLIVFIEREYAEHTVYPPKSELFSVFLQTPFDAIKVVILGQDPYHGNGQANGLAFSVNSSVKIPPSLRNIFKELETDVLKKMPTSGDLLPWAKQGVFLLNDVLSVRKASAGSHKNKGWETFTQTIIQTISDQKEHVVFLLWGNHAHKKEKLIDTSKHLILKSGHPSPMSANQGKWFGNHHFSQTNSYLEKHNKEKINW
ncbi:uracil-DNA glycosylase [uncultured Weeksella sp.]|uniref:uracil-DNA glycosylase n=1 Tax=uncultured Weeksella sp. TaxID=1161389 RepID=UPI00259AFB08|nr:uracil-DNA glycosylase [uncultured Weeksella sp.]